MPYNLESIIRDYSILAVGAGLILLSILLTLSLLVKKPSESLKKIFFGSIIFVVLAPTIFLAGSTIYLNTVSVSKGPVHYHADLEIWNCGREIDLKDPTGLSNKIGTATLHEHNDKRIHLEGVVVEKKDASLGRFFEVIGGGISQDVVTIPTNNGAVTFSTGGVVCPDGEPGVLQVFVYTAKNGIYTQKKVQNPQNYIISPYSSVPTGDCIIVELDFEKDVTDKLCVSYKVAEQIGKIKKSNGVLQTEIDHMDSM